MSELTMATARPHEKPTICFDCSYHLANLHASPPRGAIAPLHQCWRPVRSGYHADARQQDAETGYLCWVV